MRRNLLSIIFFLFISSFAFAQDKNSIDSLTHIAEKNPQDTNSIAAYLQLSQSVVNSDYKKSLGFALSALAVSNTMDIAYWKGRCYLQIGNCHNSYGHTKEAVQNYRDAIPYFEQSGNSKSFLGKCYNNIGNQEKKLGRYKDAMDNYMTAKTIYEEAKDKKGLAGIYNNIGIILLSQEQYGKANEYFFRAREMNIEINNKPWLGINLMNIGAAYYGIQQYDSAGFYFKESQAVYKEAGDMTYWSMVLMNLGNVYNAKKDLNAAMQYYNEALDYNKANGKEANSSSVLSNLAEAYVEHGNMGKAKIALDSALALGKKYDDAEALDQAYKGYATLYEKTGDFKNAHEYYKLYASMRDSMSNADLKAQMGVMEESFRDEKQKKEIELLTQKNEVQREQSELDAVHSKIVIYTSISCAILVLGLTLIIYKRYQLKKKANIELEERNQQIELKNAIIEEKSKDISDSINYAKKIQDTLLPEITELKNSFPEAFVFFRPKNVVSGDFYWFYKTTGEANSEAILVAAADCTGHGVPGAFMSMIGIDKFNQAVMEFNISKPVEILSTVNRWVKTILKQDDETGGMRDGMDVSLISIDRKKMSLDFAGANRPLWIVRDGQLIELPSTKASLGGHTPILQEFALRNFELKKNDCVYLFTDGYADQFGGEKGKKLMTKNFKRLLLSFAKESMDMQKKILSETFEKWMGGNDQVDDVCVLGIRI